ncbi:hypothetical protein [Leptospira santarosai]|uniref:hypothetical protein n=1 Tax=Leptospira santarosai TaxID=28183 RepID=UPI00062D2273|nr:hypothetical protein [Leptospira santarosai]AVV52233.1 Uncharacterized protein XB17_03672 [Leptospira santarosai]OLY62413.1 hypothetical protein BWD11_20330 [Leptospira santarosai serovar Grippotyphosa]ONF75768.1 hypothetical protein BWD12_20090 [Leptospira santarosai serovar Bananal]
MSIPEYSDLMDFKYTPKGVVFHAIDFSGYSGIVNIPDSLRLYNGFFEDTERRRVGFRVQNGSVYRETNIANIYSNDPQIPQFNKLFSLANVHIPNFSQSIKTYDFDSGGTAVPLPESVKDWLDKIFKEIKDILLIGLCIYLAWKIFGDEIMGRKKR